MVTAWAAVVEPSAVDAKVSVVGERETVSVSTVPVRATVWGEPVALSSIVRFAFSVPVVVGLKVIDTVQVAAAARVAGETGHVVVDVNEVGLVPVNAMLLMVTAFAL